MCAQTAMETVGRKAINSFLLILNVIVFTAGKCKGNGTRRGNGKCACAEGYAGENCNVCAQGYYESFRDENKVLCSLCHVSCEAEHGCTTSGPRGNCYDIISCLAKMTLSISIQLGCRVCSKGWVMEPERGGCVDADECAAPVRPCSSNQFCVNNEGSHSCLGKMNAILIE